MSERENPQAEEKVKDNRPSVEQVVSRIDEIREETRAPTMKSSWERAQEGGNPHPIPPEERTAAQGGPQNRAALDAAAGNLEAARTAALTHDETEKRLRSDPRYERDQKVFEMARTGRIANVPPSEAELAAQNINLPEEVREAIPKNAEEQVSEDMQRLEEGERKAQAIRDGEVSKTDTTKPEQEDKDSNSDTTGGVKKFQV